MPPSSSNPPPAGAPAPQGPPHEPTQRLSEATVLNPSASSSGDGLSQPPPRTTLTGEPAATHGASAPGMAATSMEQPGALPQNLGSRYRLIRVLGKGGFANVYLAQDSTLDQEVAVKILKLGLASKSDTERFLFEARVGAKLRHPNIATVFDILQTPEGLQMIMEYYPHGTLADRIKRKGAMRPREAIDVTRQVAQALSYAHRRNFVHRDVKPANIFLAGEGVIKLGDFGIAADTDLHEHTATGMVIGTPLYMAPEQATDSRSVDPRADIYALGLTLYYMLTGKPPRVIDLDLVAEPFRKLIKNSTEPDRNQRLVSCEQFIAMLDQIEREVQGRSNERAELGEAMPETVLEHSRAPFAADPISGEGATGNLGASSAGQAPPTGAAFNSTLTAVADATHTQGLTTTGSGASQQTTITQMTQSGGVPRYVWVLVGVIVLLSLPSIFIGWRVTLREMDSRPTVPTPPSVAAANLSVPADGAINAVVATGTETPLATPTVSPTPSHSATPSPSPSPTKAPSTVQVLPIATPTATPPPTPRPSATPEPPRGPMTVVEAMALALEERPRIKRTSELMAAAEREPTMRAYNLQLARENIELELRDNPEDTLAYLVLGVVLRREGRLPEARRAMMEGLRLNHQSERPLMLERPLLIRALGLQADEYDVLPQMPDRPPAPGQRPPRRPGEGQAARPPVQ